MRELCYPPFMPQKKKKKTKQQYRIRNWSDYNKALVGRGSLTLWFDEEAIESWLNHERSGKRGKPRLYADACILCMLTLKAVYHLPQRSTQGLISSLMQLMGLALPIPHHTILSKRAKSLEVSLPRQRRDQPIHLVVDATGFKIFGEGEWKVRVHGYSKRRTWRKLHIGMDEATGEIVAAVASDKDMADKHVLPDLLAQIDEEIAQVSADGGYDYTTCYEAIAERKARAVIPPRRNARLHPKDERLRARDRNIKTIRRVGRKQWKKRMKYHRRSLVETAFMREKCIFGEKLSARKFDNQATEMFIRCATLNRMTHLGMPESYRI
jgi:IS5 family transposase